MSPSCETPLNAVLVFPTCWARSVTASDDASDAYVNHIHTGGQAPSPLISDILTSPNGGGPPRAGLRELPVERTFREVLDALRAAGGQEVSDPVSAGRFLPSPRADVTRLKQVHEPLGNASSSLPRRRINLEARLMAEKSAWACAQTAGNSAWKNKSASSETFYRLDSRASPGGHRPGAWPSTQRLVENACGQLELESRRTRGAAHFFLARRLRWTRVAHDTEKCPAQQTERADPCDRRMIQFSTALQAQLATSGYEAVVCEGAFPRLETRRWNNNRT